jgi:ABC-type uncharacterized transport system involved in gliding motility auxiliary subunit
MEAAWLSPSVRGALLLALQVALALVLFAVLELIAVRHNVRFDLTPTQAFVLSPSARQVAAEFDRPVRVTAFYSTQEEGQRREMLDLLEQFKSVAPALEFRLADLDRSPGLAKRYNVASYNSGVLEAEGRMLALRSIDEGEITHALLTLSRHRQRTLCFVTGHGERNPDSNDERSGYSEVAKALEGENFRIRALNTIPMQGVPEDCTVLILAGPSHDLLPGESEALERHLRAHGKVLVLVDPDAPRSVLDFLQHAGVQAGDNLIVDQSNRFIGADSFMPHVLRFRSETFRDGLQAPAVLALARTIRPFEVPAGLRVTPIAATSPESWAFSGGKPDEEPRFRPDLDQPGPLSVAVIVTYGKNGAPDREAEASDEVAVTEEDLSAAGPTKGSMIVFGDSDFASNFYLNLLGNKDLFMSTVAVLAEDPALIAVRRKGLPRGTMSPISLTSRQARLVFWTAVIAVPLTFVLIGLGVVVYRRRQHGGR